MLKLVVVRILYVVCSVEGRHFTTYCSLAQGLKLSCSVALFFGSTVLVGLGEVSRSHSDTPHSVGLLWTSDRIDAETST
jgi:hypothetical protein